MPMADRAGRRVDSVEESSPAVDTGNCVPLRHRVHVGGVEPPRVTRDATQLSLLRGSQPGAASARADAVAAATRAAAGARQNV
jgi:hypothetical protein